MVTLIKGAEDRTNRQPVLGLEPLVDFAYEIADISDFWAVVEGPGISNVLKWPNLLIVYNDSLLLALKDLIILFKLFVALQHLLIRHFAADVTTNLAFFFVAVELSLNTLLGATFILQRLESSLVLIIHVSVLSSL